jgi:hypothetical protein
MPLSELRQVRVDYCARCGRLDRLDGFGICSLCSHLPNVIKIETIRSKSQRDRLAPAPAISGRTRNQPKNKR